MADFILARAGKEYKAAAALFREPAACPDIDLGFQHFEEEFANLKSMYALP